MRACEPGELAVQLAWLQPGLASLAALARGDAPAIWSAIRHDPGAVLLAVQHASSTPRPLISIDALTSPTLLESALRRLPKKPVASSRSDSRLHQAARVMAATAEAIARRAGGCDPAAAWAAGLLAPLGWWAVEAVDPDAVDDCFRQPGHSRHMSEIQQHLWGLDAAAIGRRLARRWNLPDWLRSVVGYLAMPLDTAETLGADVRLFPVVQLALSVVQAGGHDLGIGVGMDQLALRNTLGLSESALEDCCTTEHGITHSDQQAPDLLHELLSLAIEKRRLEDGPYAARMEEEIDRWQQALADQRMSEDERLGRLKLRAMAELAAGAGHEINNPLAVISGQSQVLQRTEADPAKLDSLRTIVRQTERIHQILNDLMQFARPPRAWRQHIDLRSQIREVLNKLRGTADARSVTLEWTEPAEPISVHVDPAMIRTALSGLVRNGIEAAGKDGQVHVQVCLRGESWHIAVSDSGPGPLTSQREHMFDPFYSGRAAGRGRGLGLPTAWRLAQENHGDVSFEPLPEQPARFVLTLPRGELAAQSNDGENPQLKIA